ncbi:unnamed protein product [Didymodactylos carnosus]|uniref:Ephrin RBD domain-containing protein n=2 Tax=Didymodactylos carnosus TaxID=1234261 RepID=A0A813UVE3_9BILA|nr:unnamed protein product [Didymodactylos carnosus]CAF3620132.1 unnamed protein product [Didymodactylos carnosus]
MFTYECCAISRYLLILFVYIQLINAVLLEPFYWNTTTFRPYRNSEISFDVRLGDAMDVVCPYYNEQQSYMTNDLEYYDIYQVTENEYETCRIYSLGDNRLTRLVISCNSPHEIMKYTLNFREYLPIPNGFEFNAGHTYYFISTSDSTEFGRQDMESGSCEKHSTRIKIHVGRRHQQYHPSTTTTTSSYPLRPATNSLSKYRNPIWTALRAERHSDSHSIAWITQWPKVDDDSNLGMYNDDIDIFIDAS